MNCHEGFFLARFLEEIIAIKKNFGLLLGYRVHAEEQLQGARATNLPHLHLWYEKKLQFQKRAVSVRLLLPSEPRSEKWN